MERGGKFGWRSWVGQKIAKPIQTAGKEMIERRYRLDAEAVKAKIDTIDEQLRKEKDSKKIVELTKNLFDEIDKWKLNSYVMKSISESIGKMSRISFQKIATNKNAITNLINPDTPLEVREKIIDQVEKLNKETLREIFKDIELLQSWNKSAPDIANTFRENSKKNFLKLIG